jgi:serine/threonine-protein kinase
MPLTTGQILQQRYRVDAELGAGGMGAVYRGLDLRFNAAVAIKENKMVTGDAQRQFAREAGLLYRLRHPNLPRVIDHFSITENDQFLIMDYVDGLDLQEVLERYGPIPQDRALPWMGKVLDALDYLHRQTPSIIHRDVKPANIKITPEANVFLVDFGLAKFYDPDGYTTTGAQAATPGYAPPEQYGAGRTDGRTDVYSVGATLYCLLTGQAPPSAMEIVTRQATMIPPRNLNPNISPMVESAILRAMQVAPDDRFQSAAALRRALLSSAPIKPAGVAGLAAAGTPVVAPPPATPPPATPPPDVPPTVIPERAPTPPRAAPAAQRGGRNWLWLLLAALILILCLGVGGLGYWALNPGEATPTVDLPATLAAAAATQTAMAVPSTVAPPVSTNTPIPTDALAPTDTPLPIMPSDTPIPLDTPLPTDTPVPPTLTPTPVPLPDVPDLFQEGLVVQEQAEGGTFTGPQQRTILSIEGPKVTTERQRGASTYTDTSWLNSGHYLGNDGSAPWIPPPVLRALVRDGVAPFNTTRNQEGVVLELADREFYPVLVDGEWVDLPVLVAYSSQDDFYIVLEDPRNPYVLEFDGGATADDYFRYVETFVTGLAPPEPPPARLFAVVYPGSDGLSLRDGPGVKNQELAILRKDTLLEATGGAMRGSDGLTWWPVSTPRGAGWVAEWANNWRLIKPVFEPGDTVYVYNPQSSGNVNLRTASCDVDQILPRGTELFILEGPATKCDSLGDSIISQGRRWWWVVEPGGSEGWVADFTSAPDKRMLIAPQWYLDLVLR